jgi:hypothetical protein
MLSHSGIEFQPPGLPSDGGPTPEMPPGLPVVHQMLWINGKPFDFVTT